MSRVKEEKATFGELSNVLLTAREYQKLIEKLGLDKTQSYIARLDLYIDSRGFKNKYKSHYATILAWVLKDSIREKVASKEDVYRGFAR